MTETTMPVKRGKQVGTTVLRWSFIAGLVALACHVFLFMTGMVRWPLPDPNRMLKQVYRDLAALDTATEGFHQGTGRWPSREEGPQGAWIKAGKPLPLPVDPWGHAYRYTKVPADTRPHACSLGPDGLAETEDDLTDD